MGRLLKILPDIAGAYSFIIFISFVLFAGKKSLGDGDTLWHIKIGELMIDRGEILTHDIYSHTAPGKPWISHEWLAEVIMGAIHRVAGLPGVVIFYFLVAALSFWILFIVAQRCGASEWLSIFSVSLALGLAVTHLLARPHIFTWLLGVTTVYILLVGGKKLYWLPILMVPWVNLHGGFALSLALQCAFIGGRILDRFQRESARPRFHELWEQNNGRIGILLLSLLATGVNPFGYSLLLFPFEVSKEVFSTLVSEWNSPSLQAFWYFRIYLLFLFFLLFFSGPSINWTNRLLLLLLVNASLVHARHISIAGLFLTPLIVESTKALLVQLPLPERKIKPENELIVSRASGPIGLTILALLLILVQWTPWKKASEILIPLPERFSFAAIEFLKTNQPDGNLLNNDEWGDFLIYAMNPPPKLFIDGRLDMYGENILKDYANIVKLDKDADILLDSYDIGWVLFPPSPLTRYLSAGGKWQTIYSDEHVSILCRKQTENCLQK